MPDFPKIDFKTRYNSFRIDLRVMVLVMLPFAIPYMIYQMVYAKNLHGRIDEYKGALFYISCIGIALFFCKDCIYGQSPAKRVLKLQVVNNENGQIANPLRCLVRNLFDIIWPIEAVFLLINPARRLGDIVGGTKVIPFNPELPRPEISYVQIAFSFLLSYAFIIAITFITN